MREIAWLLCPYFWQFNHINFYLFIFPAHKTMDYFITDQPGKHVTAGAQLAFGIIVVICLILILGLQMGLLSRMKSEGMDVQRYVGAGLVPSNFSQVLSSGATLRNEGAVMSSTDQGPQDIGLSTYNQYADMSRRS